jgi:hypothetical protein
MGRGRAKAKQTKVARQLKYTSHDLDPDRLRQELAGDGLPSGPPGSSGELVDEADEAEDDDDEGYAAR